MSPGPRSTGGYWNSPAIPDNLSPGQAPYPSEGEQGPPVSVPVGYLEQIRAAQEAIGQAISRRGFDISAGVASANTNSDGRAVIGIYQVAAGVEARLHRLSFNSVVPGTNVAYTFAVPYANAAAYLQLYEAEVPDQPAALSNVGLLDGGPPVAGGPILPAIFSWDLGAAPVVRGPMWIVALLISGPASVQVTARYQIALRREDGIA